jgi:hypothetical protein
MLGRVSSAIVGMCAMPKGLRHGFGVAAFQTKVPPNLVQRWRFVRISGDDVPRRSAEMSYRIYRRPTNNRLLGQGDILNPDLLRSVLKGHQDYFIDRFYRYVILTQTCDLQRNSQLAEFIFIGVVRKLGDALGMRHVDGKARNSTNKLVSALYDHDYHRRGFFYLPQSERYGIGEESVADLRVMFTIHKYAYPDVLKARLCAMTDLYTARLGQMLGHLFNRVAMPSREQVTGSDADKDAEEVVNGIKKREDQILAELMEKFDKTCAVRRCDRVADTYRWVPVGKEKNGQLRFDKRILCRVHVQQYEEFRSGQSLIMFKKPVRPGR